MDCKEFEKAANNTIGYILEHRKFSYEELKRDVFKDMDISMNDSRQELKEYLTYLEMAGYIKLLPHKEMYIVKK